MSVNPLVVMFQAPPTPYFLESGKAVYEPGDMHPNRTGIGVFDLLFVVEGTLYIGEEDRQWALSAGHTLLLLPNRRHYPSKPCDERTVFYWIHFQSASDWMETTDSPNLDTIALPKHWIASDIPYTIRFMQQLLDLAVRPRSVALWEQQSAFSELLRYMEEGRRAADPSPSEIIAEKTYTYIRQHYQSELTNESIAEALHFHPNYIARCMKEVNQCTPMEYVFRYRMEQARLLLLKTEWPVSRIAEQVGYRYAPYFSNCFKQHFGESPLRFRKRYSGE
ncbi:helix-turn-helix transcriptional regulator [Cohnella yongneupensis]|uniref:Helix-turn-helix domain-containing protein n=1 Tax=Cohnella yongneupensis TaxID=425006 RepID=A0ABW0R3C4_9BACL